MPCGSFHVPDCALPTYPQVVYVYNNCTIPREEVFAAAASPDATDSTPSSPGHATSTHTSTNTTGAGSAAFRGSRKLSCRGSSRLRCLLAKSVEYEAADLSYNETDGYVELLLQYQPYGECYDKGVEFFSKLVTKVCSDDVAGNHRHTAISCRLRALRPWVGRRERKSGAGSCLEPVKGARAVCGLPYCTGRDGMLW